MESGATDDTWGVGPEPIAIIGIGCRFPGESFSPSRLWDLLKDGKSAQSDVPQNRFNLEAWYHPDSNRAGSISSRGGYFLSHDNSYQQFDSSFFGISPLEAASMDPQQRKLLEVVYECFESAGATLEGLSGSKTSCYVGCFTHDAGAMNAREAEYGIPYAMTGADMTILSNRINYVFNLKGPSMTVDTACSSSLYALHMACQSLLSGDAVAAVVGGTNVILGIEQHIASVRLGVLSPTSTCHTFDAAADGFGRGEGICAIYLKKLSDAIANKDPIRGVIRSTAVNANGRSQGINHPSSVDQEYVIRAAYEKAGLNIDETGFFECHGTGTKVGDPVEVNAIGNVFAASRTSNAPLLLGSIKTNIGHTEGASGLASVIKAVLSIENNLIPATVGVTTLNPSIDFREGRLEVVTKPTLWPKGRLKRASINSFGYGGANAHCIVESPQILLGAQQSAGSFHETSVKKTVRQTDKRYLLVHSAHDQPTLKKNVASLAESAGSHCLPDMAYTLAYRRTMHRMRAFTVVHGCDTASQIHQDTIYGERQGYHHKAIAFTFTGQGAQWPRMGYDLVRHYPIVQKTMEELQASLDNLPAPPEWRLLDELSKLATDSRVQEAALSQPLCTAIQIAVTVLLNSWGVRPNAVVGHSSGEVAAAFAAGLLRAEEAIAVAYYRGISVEAKKRPGAMMAVGLGALEVRHYTDTYPDIVIACHNSPQSVTLSGSKAAVNAIYESLVKDRVFARILKTQDNAYHSHLVKEAGQYYQDCFESSLPRLVNTARSSDIPMYSCITGKVLKSQNDVGIAYWRKNLEEPVLFTQALSSLISGEPGISCLIEIGPHSALAGPIRQIRSSVNRSSDDLDYLPTVIRNEDATNSMLKLAGSLFVAGFPLDMKAINADGFAGGNLLVNLPLYQWNYDDDTPWIENRLSHQLRFRTHPRHDLLGSRLLGTSSFSPEWRNRLRLKDVPWISDHVIGDDVIFPAAGYMAMAIEAATQVAEVQGVIPRKYTIQHLVIKAPIVLHPDSEVEILFSLRVLSDSNHRGGKKWFGFNVASILGNNKWTEHAVGTIAVEEIDRERSAPDLKFKEYKQAANRSISDRQWYVGLSNTGLRYGPAFRPLKDILTTGNINEAMARIDLRPISDSMIQESRYVIHPTTLDGCLQLSAIAAHNGNVKNIIKAYLPTVINTLVLWRTTNSMTLPKEGILKSHGVCRGMRSAHGVSNLYTQDGQPIAKMAVSFYSLEGGTGTQTTEHARQPFMRLIWQPDVDISDSHAIQELISHSSSDSNWLRLADKLDEVSKLLVLSACDVLPSAATLHRQPLHIQMYARFLAEEGESLLAHSRKSSLSLEDRQERIEAIFRECGDEIPEVGLLAYLNTKMFDILRGKINSTEVILQNKSSSDGSSRDGGYEKLKRIIKLIACKQPGLKILEIGTDKSSITRPLLEALGAGSPILHYSQYTLANTTNGSSSDVNHEFESFPNMDFRTLDINKDLISQGFEAGLYDVVLVSNVIHSTATADSVEILERCKTALKPDGRLIIVDSVRQRVSHKYMLGSLPDFWQHKIDGQAATVFSPQGDWTEWPLRAGFSEDNIILNDYTGYTSFDSIIITKVGRSPQSLCAAHEKLWVVYKQDLHPLVREIEDRARKQRIEIKVLSLQQTADAIPKGSHVVMAAELEGPLLANMTTEEMKAVQILFKTASSLIWVTNGGLLQGKSPKHAMMSGIAKSIMTEQPSIRISSIDVDPDETDYAWSASVIIQHEINLRTDVDRVLDTQLILQKGVVYISRFISDSVENDAFRRQLHPIPEVRPLANDLELSFLHVGRVDSFYFKESSSASRSLNKDELLLIPLTYDLSRRGAAILKGTQDYEYFHSICVGTVQRVGMNVTRLKEGDRVICFTPGRFESSFIANETTCECLRPEEDAERLALSVLPYCEALHALKNLGGAYSGQTILVHEVSEPRHLAAVYISGLLGSRTIVTFNSDEGRTLYHKEYPILDTCKSLVVSPRLEEDFQILTDGDGIDIAITTGGTPSLPEIWKSLAKSGKLICTGDSVVPNFSILDASVFSRGASLVSFDVNNMVKDQVDEMAKLVHRIVVLLRNDLIPFLKIGESIDISELPQAVDAVLQSKPSLDVALTYRPESMVPVHLQDKPAEFPHNASYLLIGCLGGLGRSLVRWMFDHGARHFIFLSRSAADKPEAARFIKELEQTASKCHEEMTITIVRGDVGQRKVVDRAISMAKTPIRGVVQQAMFLKNELFDTMTLESWQAALDPKVQGTINLHEALINESLDFFVMTSSILGTIRVSTQSSYAAANVFLDYMARHRWSMGLPACSIALGMVVEVGHMEAHPEVREDMERNGAYGIPEDEYLKMMEVACRRRESSQIFWDWDAGSQSHIVTGMEPGKIISGRGRWLWQEDNRFRSLEVAIAGMQDKRVAPGSKVSHTTAALLSAAHEEQGEDGVMTCVQDLVVAQFSKLVLVPVDKLVALLERPLTEFGMDSMVTAELRSWAWRELRAEIPLMALLEGNTTMKGLVDLVWDKMERSIWKS